MNFDSAVFDLRQYDSCKIDMRMPLDLGGNLLAQFDNLIQALPENEDCLESWIRSIVNILIITKLQSDDDRTELDQAKELLFSKQNCIINARPIMVGDTEVISIDKWSTLTLKQSDTYSSNKLCDSISGIIDEVGYHQHLILDLSRFTTLDLNLTAYLIGLRDMLQKSNRKVSIAWLPRAAVSQAVLATLTARFRLFKKGSFLLSIG